MTAYLITKYIATDFSRNRQHASLSATTNQINI